MSRILKRPIESSWLERCLKLSHVAIIEGLKGVGKTTQIRTWVREKNLSSKWFTLSNFSSLSAVLGESDSDIETALGKASKKWSEFDIIIWDDVHHLDLQTQNYLLSFLLQTSGEQTHLIMSDEHLNAPLEVPCLKMQGFSREQSLEYLKQIDIEIPQDEFENFYHLTGGLPLFIQLWIQDPGNLKRQEITFGNLSAEAKNFLSTMSFYPHQFKLEELKLTEVKNLKAVVAELQKKMLLTQVGDSFEVTPFVRDFVNHGLSTQQIQEHARQILPMLLSSPLSSKLQILSGALQAQSLDVLEELSKEFKTSWLEGVSSKNLSLLTQLTEQVQAESLKPFVLRMQLHALILQNRRSDALELADKILKKYDDLEPKEQQILFLIYECLYWMNRSEKFEVTEKRISYYVNISPLPVKFFFKVEQALPLIGKEPKSAEETLLRVAQEIAKYRDKKEDLNLVLAHTNYQLGVCTNQQRKFQEAADYFKTAHELYQECGRVYFSLFSLFNFVWALYAQKDFQKIDEWMPKISKPAEMHGYKYLQAGLLWLESQKAYWSLESSLALDKIIESSSKLERSTPLQAKVDILSTKARILNDLGFSARAQDVITEMKSFYEKEPPARLLSLELEMGFRHLPLEDFREEWGRLGRSEDEDVFKVYLLQRGMKPELTDSLLERTPRGALALKTFAVFESQKGKDKDILWRAVADLEALLKKVSEPRMEKIALHCYQAQLHPQEVQTLLEKAELELARWGSDTQGKWLFELWIKSLRGNVNLFSAENFRKIDISLRERWETWFKTTEKKQGRYVLKTIDGSSSVDKAPSQGHARAVTLIEDLGKVFLNGSLVEDFNRKSVLRQMLALFLEVFPDKLSKANLASALWGEIYSPQIHDARIYTSIQRLRALIDDSAIENWDGGYRWSPGCAFYFYRSQVEEKLGSHRVKTLILESLRKMSDSENPWLSRADLVELSDSSDATVKRIISELLHEGYLIRKGRGPSVVYAIDPNKT